MVNAGSFSTTDYYADSSLWNLTALLGLAHYGLFLSAMPGEFVGQVSQRNPTKVKPPVHYRRACIPGGSYFFTVFTTQRRPLFAEQANIDALRKALRHVRQQRPFQIDAIVVLPEHLHCIW